MRLVLASGSPRRRDLLTALGLVFETVVPAVDETPRPGEPPVDYVRRVAGDKARAVHGPDAATIAADTTVVVDGEILGKPGDGREAAAMLARLAGRSHLVHTAVTVIGPGGEAADVATAEVTMVDLDPDRIAWYVGTGEPLDKAGAYGLQGLGGVFVSDVRGDPTAVVGLPLALLRATCRAAGFELLDHGASR
ncbi:MAG: nucleoside triphosphate pyrophosphatase [Acidimicrobiia bacterium]